MLVAIVAAVGAAAKIAEAVQTIHGVLDGARTVVLIVENHTDLRLENSASTIIMVASRSRP